MGFEPMMELPPYHLSRVAPSTARPALRVRIAPVFVQDGAFSRPASSPRAFAAQNAPPEPFVPVGTAPHPLGHSSVPGLPGSLARQCLRPARACAACVRRSKRSTGAFCPRRDRVSPTRPLFRSRSPWYSLAPRERFELPTCPLGGGRSDPAELPGPVVAFGGWSGIRTHGTVPRTLVFKTRALNHSATHPYPLRTPYLCAKNDRHSS